MSSPSHAIRLLQLSSALRIGHQSGSERNRLRRNVHVRVFSRCWSFWMNRRDRPVVERRRDQWHCFECSYLQREKERKGLQISIYLFLYKKRKKETGAKRIVDRPGAAAGHCISAVELRMKRTTIANNANNAKIIRLPNRLFNQDVELLLLDDDGDEATIDRSAASAFVAAAAVDALAVRSFRTWRISSVRSGNNSRKTGSSTLNANESYAYWRFWAWLVSILPNVALVSHMKLRKPFRIDEIDLQKDAHSITTATRKRESRFTTKDSTNLDETKWSSSKDSCWSWIDHWVSICRCLKQQTRSSWSSREKQLTRWFVRIFEGKDDFALIDSAFVGRFRRSANNVTPL